MQNAYRCVLGNKSNSRSLYTTQLIFVSKKIVSPPPTPSERLKSLKSAEKRLDYENIESMIAWLVYYCMWSVITAFVSLNSVAVFAGISLLLGYFALKKSFAGQPLNK